MLLTDCAIRLSYLFQIGKLIAIAMVAVTGMGHHLQTDTQMATVMATAPQATDMAPVAMAEEATVVLVEIRCRILELV